MPVDVRIDLAELVAGLDRAAEAAETALGSSPANQAPSPALAEGEELRRQLASLRGRVKRARGRADDPRALRSELATLLFFARTLEADASAWRGGLEEAIRERERETAAARREQERHAAERAQLAQRRDALQSTIVQIAARMARTDGGECRRTLPVFTLSAHLTVCSVSVSCPRRGLRFPKHWLVTLDESHEDVVVRRA